VTLIHPGSAEQRATCEERGAARIAKLLLQLEQRECAGWWETSRRGDLHLY